MTRPSMFEFAGGEPAFLALAAACHERCMQDPELNHAFSQTSNPQHIENLAAYWAEVFGGPARYSGSLGGHSAMLGIHAQTGAPENWGDRFAACFFRALDDAGMPEDPDFRASLRAYIDVAAKEIISISPPGATVSPGLPVPGWSWDGPE